MANTYQCSDGEKITQAQIKTRLSQAYAQGPRNAVCECCGQAQAVDHDHTIAQRTCKELGKSELIYDPANWVHSCRKCHNEWEQHNAHHHLNYSQRMAYMQMHAPEIWNRKTALKDA